MIRIIDVNGDAYTRGKQYGSQAREKIHTNIRHYYELFKDRKGIDAEQAHQLALAYEKAIDACQADYRQEMQGIADGAEAAYLDILMLNCRSEILFTDITEDTQECTAFALLPRANEEQVTYAAQSWDFAATQRDVMIVLRLTKTDGRKLMIFTEAGLIGGKGLNSDGLALTLNALNTPGQKQGLPLHIRMRKILDCTTLAAAYQQAVALPVPAAANLIISHQDGLAMDLEITPKGSDVLYPQHGIIAHTNHLLSSKLNITDHNHYAGSTHVRYASINELLHDQPLNLQRLQHIFADHRGYPTSICVHSDQQLPLIKQLVTNHALIMDVTHQICYYVEGNPCQNSFSKLEL